MKLSNITIKTYTLIVFIMVACLVIGFMPSTDACERIEVRTGIEVYTEANHATNYIADLQPGDVLYICGE